MSRHLIIIFAVLFLASCKKDDQCQSTKRDLAEKNREEAAAFVTRSILLLGPKAYNEKNLHKLAEKISNSCDIKVELRCFDCIKTLPAQSEMSLSFSYAGTTMVRTIDLTSTKDNETRFVNIHD
jgi:hypothetical protein